MSLRRITSVATATAVAFSLAAAPAAHADVSIHKDRANNTCTIKLTGNSRAVSGAMDQQFTYALAREVINDSAKFREFETFAASVVEKMGRDGVDVGDYEATDKWYEDNVSEVEKMMLPAVAFMKEKGLNDFEAVPLALELVASPVYKEYGSDVSYSSPGVINSVTFSDTTTTRKFAKKIRDGKGKIDSVSDRGYADATKEITSEFVLAKVGFDPSRRSDALVEAATRVVDQYGGEAKALRKISKSDFIIAANAYEAKYNECLLFIGDNHSGTSNGKKPGNQPPKNNAGNQPPKNNAGNQPSKANDGKQGEKSKGSSEGPSPVLIVVGVLVALAAAAAGAVGAGLIPVPGLPGAPK